MIQGGGWRSYALNVRDQICDPEEATFALSVWPSTYSWGAVTCHHHVQPRLNPSCVVLEQPFKNGDVLTVCVNMGTGVLSFSRNGQPLGEAFIGLTGPLVAAVTLASEESKITIQNRPTVLNTGEYIGELRWDEARSGKDLHVVDGLTVSS